MPSVRVVEGGSISGCGIARRSGSYEGVQIGLGDTRYLQD